MKAATKSTAKHARKPAKSATVGRMAKNVAGGSALRGRVLTGKALLNDMEDYRTKVTATPDAARGFLIRMGVMTPSGKLKQLTRG